MNSIERTIAEARRINKANGNYFFSRKTMKFFNSRIESGILKGKYFITSEQYSDETPRKYTIRCIDWNTGEVKTVGEFNELKTKEAAKIILKDLK